MERAERLGHARAALAAYAGDKGDPFDAGRLTEEEIGDLVADLQHLASAEGLNWRRVLALAELHHRAEVGGFARRTATDRTLGRRR